MSFLSPPPVALTPLITNSPIDRHRFLLSTHYTHYEPVNFGINFLALLFVLTPKLPQVRKLSLAVSSPLGSCKISPPFLTIIAPWKAFTSPPTS